MSDPNLRIKRKRSPSDCLADMIREFFQILVMQISHSQMDMNQRGLRVDLKDLLVIRDRLVHLPWKANIPRHESGCCIPLEFPGLILLLSMILNILFVIAIASSFFPLSSKQSAKRERRRTLFGYNCAALNNMMEASLSRSVSVQQRI